jgi:hypothetical protein
MTHVLDEEVEHYIRLLTEGLDKDDRKEQEQTEDRRAEDEQ